MLQRSKRSKWPRQGNAWSEKQRLHFDHWKTVEKKEFEKGKTKMENIKSNTGINLASTVTEVFAEKPPAGISAVEPVSKKNQYL